MRKNVLLLVVTLTTIVFSMMFAGAAILYGDLNADGSVDSTDVTILKRVLLKKMTIEDTVAADLNGDGEVNSTDLTLLKRYLLKKITKFPVEDMDPTIAPTPSQEVTPTPSQEVTPTPTETDGAVFASKIRMDKGDMFEFPIRYIGEHREIAVDWGDGTTSVITTNSKRHWYNEEGTYTIKVLSFDYMPLKFSGDTRLLEILMPLPDISETSFRNYFSGCSNLTKIPEGLFKNNVNATNFEHCFSGCSSLTEIPEGIFANNVDATNFSYCFYECSSLTKISEGLFANNINVTDFSYCFSKCSNLTEIPEGLFAYNKNVTDFSYCFSKCSNLTEIPEALFANNINVAHFDYCFSGCSNLTGLAPSLWLRTNVTKYNTCFYGCTKLSNYEDIPYDWKGKYEEPTKIEMTLGSFMTSGPNFVMTGSVINSFIRFKTKEVVSVDLIIQQDTYTAKIIASDHDMVNLQGIILNGEPNVVVICNFPYIDENRNLGIDLKISNQSGKMVTISLADKNNAVRITDRDGSVISGYSESENVMIVNKTKSGTN